MRQRVFLTDLALQPPPAAGFTFPVAPHIPADVYAFVLLDPLVAYVAVILFQLFKERFLKVFLFWRALHARTLCKMILDHEQATQHIFIQGISPGTDYSASGSGRAAFIW